MEPVYLPHSLKMPISDSAEKEELAFCREHKWNLVLMSWSLSGGERETIHSLVQSSSGAPSWDQMENENLMSKSSISNFYS